MRQVRIGASITLVCSLGGVAHAQDAADTEEEVDVRAPKGALELGVNGGYTQPFGDITVGEAIHDIVDAGGAVGLSLGWRFSPFWSLEGVGTFHESKVDDSIPGDVVDIRGVSTGVQATFHFLPYDRVDPYLSLGTGYRMMWIVPTVGSNTLIHGFQAARALFGVDFRVTDSFAMGPSVGADLNLFMWENDDDGNGSEPLDAVSPNTFVFAGLGGRFDMGGKRVPERRPVARTEMVPTPAAGPAPARKPPPSTGVRVDPRILELCKIEEKKAFFEFDSSALDGKDTSILDAVAQCFTSGPLKGRGMEIIGRADPRGTDEYNRELGKSRAQSVTDYLGGKGVNAGMLSVTSRGEEEATGTDELGWAWDRRVDLMLVPTPAEKENPPRWPRG